MDFIDGLKGLSFQQKRILKEQAQDLVLWGGAQIEDLWPKDYNPKSKVEATKVFDSVMARIGQMRCNVSFNSFSSGSSSSGASVCSSSSRVSIVPDFKAPHTIMGRCPCPDESQFLRCCNLKTLDAVQQCAFACSYCSIRNFYSDNEIRVVSDLDKVLSSLVLDPNVWHIGTGQSSDSLLLGDDYGTLTALGNFARKYPNVVIELKTKSSRTDWLSLDLPRNIVATWSLNAESVVDNEEHLTSSLSARIEAAAKCAEHGRLVGFHIHPMMRFDTWKEEYASLVDKLTSSVDPTSVVMVGIGTLTFTKSALKSIRESKFHTHVTQMPLTPIAGKFSYPFEMKKEMFSHLYSCFPQSWNDNVFFYLCMEDPALWQPCLGRSYESNAEFEKAMKEFYLAKIKTG